MLTTPSVQDRLRAQCESLRVKPTPLKDLIPLMQEAANLLDAQKDRIDSLEFEQRDQEINNSIQGG